MHDLVDDLETRITPSRGVPSSPAPLPGPSPLCWASNLASAAVSIATVSMLGVPLVKAFLAATTNAERAVIGLAFLAVVSPSSLRDVFAIVKTVRGAGK